MIADLAGHDAHCHLDLFPDPGAAIEQRRNAKLFTIAVTTTPAAFAQNMAWSRGNPYVVPALGAHPELVGQRPKDFEALLEIMPSAKVIGEIGLDGSPQHRPIFELQRQAFERIVAEADRLGDRVLSIHSRRAAKPVIEILERNAKRDRVQTVLHWFSGSASELKKAADRGCWFSVNGSMLASVKGRDLVLAMPSDRILIETDAPFRADDGLAAQQSLCDLKRFDPSHLRDNLQRLLGTDICNASASQGRSDTLHLSTS